MSFKDKIVGKSIALRGPGGFVQMRADGSIGYWKENGVNTGALKIWRSWERFLVVDACSDGTIALYSWRHGMFVRVDGSSNATMRPTDLPPASTAEKFRIDVVHEGDVTDDNFVGFKVSFHNLHDSCLFNVEGDELFDIVMHPSPIEKAKSAPRNAMTFPEHLLSELKSGNVIAFLGAGFSFAAGLPGWVDLIKIIKSKIPNLRPSLLAEIDKLVFKGTAECLDQAAQMLEDACNEQGSAGKDTFKRLIAEVLTPSHPLPQCMIERLDCLKKIPFKAILTTNMDTVVPGSISNFTPEASKVRRDILRSSPKLFYEQLELHHANSPPVPVLQLHGSINDPEEMVFTRKGYRKLIHGSESYTGFLKSIMSQYTILYIGFSFSDYYLNDVRSSVLNMLFEQGRDRNDEPLANAITNDKTEEECDFFLTHEGTFMLNYTSTGGDHSELDKILHEIRMATSPTVEFGKTLSGKRIIWNDDFADSREHLKFLCGFVQKCVDDAAGASCDFVFVTSATEAIDLVKRELQSSSPYDLIITQFGQYGGKERSNQRTAIEAHLILKEIKRLQLQEMDDFTAGSESDTTASSEIATCIGGTGTRKRCRDETSERDTGIDDVQSTSSREYIHFPAVIVAGTNFDYERRKNQVTRLGALDYCGWGDEFTHGELSAYDLQFLGALYRAFSRKQEVK